MWKLLENANTYEGSLYKDWFIASFGEIEQLRLSFGPTHDGASKDNFNTLQSTYFGKAVFGSEYYCDSEHTDYVTKIYTTSVCTYSNKIRKHNVAWVTWLDGDVMSDRGNPHWRDQGKYDVALVLVRTF